MTGLREVALWKPEVEVERRPDGTVVMRRADPLKPHPHRITDRMAHWAETAPDRVWMAQRVDGGDWRRVTYAEAMAAIRSLGQAMLGLGLSAERPLMILSGNDIEHALMALGAQHVGSESRYARA